MNKTNTSIKYTDADFVHDVVAIFNGKIKMTQMTPARVQAMKNRAAELLNAQTKKA